MSRFMIFIYTYIVFFFLGTLISVFHSERIICDLIEHWFVNIHINNKYSIYVILLILVYTLYTLLVLIMNNLEGIVKSLVKIYMYKKRKPRFKYLIRGLEFFGCLALVTDFFGAFYLYLALLKPTKAFFFLQDWYYVNVYDLQSIKYKGIIYLLLIMSYYILKRIAARKLEAISS